MTAERDLEPEQVACLRVRIVATGELRYGAEGRELTGDGVRETTSSRMPEPAESPLAIRLTALESRIYLSLHGIDAESQELATLARESGDLAAEIRARLMAADWQSRMGDADAALSEQLLLVQLSRPWPALVRRATMLLATSESRLGDRDGAMHSIRAAMQDWNEDAEPRWRAEALMVFVLHAMSRSGIDHSFAQHAIAEVQTHCDPLLVSVTLANFAEAAADCGDLQVAGEYADRAAAMLYKHPEVVAPLTLDSIARARLALGELGVAEFGLTVALQLEQQLGCTDVMGDPWLTLAEVRLARGNADGAWEMIEHPRRAAWAAKGSWTRSRDLRLRSRVLAAKGSWEAAYHALERHLEAYEILRSVEGDRAVAEAEAHQAVDEERKRSQRFEQLSRTDPLTELPNRRHVDHWLGAVAAAEDMPGPSPELITVAILDLDHFKRVNDCYSHDAGDLVLRQVADILREVCTDPAASPDEENIAARLGGEEFVILSRGGSTTRAASIATQLLERIRDATFPEVAEDLRITASIGLASGLSSAPAGSLMRAADACLYRAKASGRDQLAAVEWTAELAGTSALDPIVAKPAV
jgi:two-component system, cell cycle response regulator